MRVSVGFDMDGCRVTASVAQLAEEDRDRVASELAWFARHFTTMPSRATSPLGWNDYFQSLLDAYMEVTVSGAQFDALPEQDRNQLLAEMFNTFVRVNTLIPPVIQYLQLFGALPLPARA